MRLLVTEQPLKSSSLPTNSVRAILALDETDPSGVWMYRINARFSWAPVTLNYGLDDPVTSPTSRVLVVACPASVDSGRIAPRVPGE